MTPSSIVVSSETKPNAKIGPGRKIKARREVSLADELRYGCESVYVNEKALPPHILTNDQIKASRLRKKKNARPCGVVATIYTSRLKFFEDRALRNNYPVITKEELRAISRAFAAVGPIVPDEFIDDLAALEEIGYATTKQVFHISDCEDKNSSTEFQRYKAACDRLYHLFFDGAHSNEHIVIADRNKKDKQGNVVIDPNTGKPEKDRGRATWRGTKPSIDKHLSGEIMVGPKRGDSSNWICPDLDNHDGLNDPAHVIKVKATIQVLELLDCPLIAEVNQKDGSTKIWAMTPGTSEAIQYLRFRLDQAHPGLGKIEVYPDDPQFFIPLRPDKITVLDRVCPKNYKGVYDPEYVTDYLDRKGKLDGGLVIETVEDILSTLPQPATPVEPCELRSQEAADKRRPITRKAKAAKIKGEPQDKLKWQGDALRAYARQLRRVPSVDEALQRLKDKKQYTGEWEDNLQARTKRIEWLLQPMAKTFDPKKCSRTRTTKAGATVLKWTDDLTRLMPVVSVVLNCDLGQAHDFTQSFLENVYVNPEHAYSWLMGRMQWFGIRACRTKAGNFLRLLRDHGMIRLRREWRVEAGVKHGREYTSNLDYFIPSEPALDSPPTHHLNTPLNHILCKEVEISLEEVPMTVATPIERTPDTS